MYFMDMLVDTVREEIAGQMSEDILIAMQQALQRA